VDLPKGAAPTKVPMQFMPTLSIAERDRRWADLRRRMNEARIDCLIFMGADTFYDMGTANLRYIFHVGGKIVPYGLFFADRDPIVWNSITHTNRPYNFNHSIQEWVSDIRTFAGMPAIAAEVFAHKLDRSRIGLVSFGSTTSALTMLKTDYDQLRAALPNAELVEAGSLLDEMRLIKSEEEIGMLRVAGSIARKVIDAAMDCARPGVTEATLFAEMIRTQIANGAEPNVFNLFNAGPVEHPETELWHLLHGVEQPQVPSMRPLEEGDLILTEYHTKYGGYLCHTEYTMFVGKSPPPELVDLYKIAAECLDVSQEVLTEGKTLREAWEAIRAPAVKADIDWVELGFHAMGVGSPEVPSVVYREGYGSNALNGHGIGDMVLREGMCLGNNIDLFNPRWKVDVGIMLADFMVVRKSGPAELLVNTPRELGLVYD
jgi:Xaa-Pro aminopeptidase